MMKRFLPFVIAILMALPLAACGSKTAPAASTTKAAATKAAVTETAAATSKAPATAAPTETPTAAPTAATTTDGTGMVAGGWQVNNGDIAVDKNKEVKAAFEKAVDKLDGCDYEPVAYLGSQVVAGTNYCILCKATPVVPNAKSSYVFMYIAAGLDGSATISEIKDLGEESTSSEPVLGGFEINQGKADLASNKEANAAFEKATSQIVGATYEAAAYLGSQVVSGTNYCILCRITPVVPDAQGSFSFVNVYKDLKGNASISDIKDITL